MRPAIGCPKMTTTFSWPKLTGNVTDAPCIVADYAIPIFNLFPRLTTS